MARSASPARRVSRALAPEHASPSHAGATSVIATRAATGPAAAVLRLQRIAGNRVVTQLAGAAGGTVVQRVVGTTLMVGTPVWIWIDQHTRVRGTIQGPYNPLDNTYVVLADKDYGAGVFAEPQPFSIVRTRLDPIGDEPMEGPKLKVGTTEPKPPPTLPPQPETPASPGFRAVVIGGGPVGLLAAIEARRRGAAVVTVYEGRTEPYSRKNVPTLNRETLAKLKQIGVYDELFGSGSFLELFSGPKGSVGGKGGVVAIKFLEDVLHRKATSLGITVVRGFRPKSVKPTGGEKGTRPTSATITLSGTKTVWLHEEQGGVETILPKQVPVEREEVADLVIVATGGGASDDPFVTEQLGFEFRRLVAKDYGVYALFEHVGEAEGVIYQLKQQLRAFRVQLNLLPALEPRQPETPQHRSTLSTLLRRGEALTDFETPEHDYILGFLSGITQVDFELLKINRDDPPELKEKKARVLRMLGDHIGLFTTWGLGPKFRELLSGERSVDVFEVKIRQAIALTSPHFPAILVGDAAATPHPKTGSGLNIGVASMEGVGELVQGLVSGVDPEKALQQYEQKVGALTAVAATNALFSIAQAFEFKIAQLFPRSLTAWRVVFKKLYGQDWDDWHTIRLSLAKAICDKAKTDVLSGHPDYAALDLAWTLIDEVYDVIEKAYAGTGVFEHTMERLEPQET